jgi:hypothetical protein
MRSYVYAGVSARTAVALGGQVHCVTRRASWREYDLPEGAHSAVAVACG